MDFYGILFDIKNGSKMPYSKNYFDTLFAAKLEELGVKTLTGTLPLTFRTSETALRSYTIYGNNYEHKYSAAGTLPLTFTTHTAGAADTWVIEGNSNVGKNLISVPSIAPVIDHGVTFTFDPAEGTITANGTATGGQGRYAIYIEPSETINVYLSGCPAGGSSSSYNAYPWDSTAGARPKKWDGVTAQTDSDYGDGDLEVQIPAGHSVSITLRIEQGYTANNVGFKPMYRKAGTSPDFEPYQIGVGEQRQDGYYVPLTVSQTGQTAKNYDIFIGDSPLTSGDYIDYEAGKIYKAKRIHEDTVTIDGIVWDILDYDHDEVYKADGTRAKHTVTIQTHDIINNLQYSARQAAFAFPDGLAAGTYHFTIGEQPWFAGDVNKVLTFTLANAIPTGGQLVFNGAHNKTLVGTTISAFASPTSTTVAETVTMTEGDTGTDLGTILRSKTDTVNNIDHALRGSNNWLESAMRQYLNSDKAAGNVWTPQTVFDRPPEWASTTAGFLNGKSNNFISHIGTAKKTTGRNSISDGGGTAVNDEKLFLLSQSEVFMGDEFAGGEGTPYAYYKDYSDSQSPSTAADSNRIKYRVGIANTWWLRTPTVGVANLVRLVNSSGAWYYYFANSGYGVAPTCCIVLDDMDDWVKQTFYTEVDAELPAIELFEGENTISTTLYNKPETSITYTDYIGVGEYVNGQWQIPLTVSDGTNTTTVNVPIDAPLTASDTATKTSTGVDIPTYVGTNTISTTSENKPETLVYYGYKGVGEHVGDTWELYFITSANGNQQLTKITMDKPLRAGETLTSEQASVAIPTYADAENTLSLYPSAAGYGNPEMTIKYKE